MFNGSNCDRKSQLSGILTEPLNPRGRCIKFTVFRLFTKYSTIEKNSAKIQYL